MSKDWELHLGDCIEGMQALEDKSVDHVITDPPYAPRAMKNATTQSMVQRRDGKVYEFGYAALTPELRKAACTEFARLARRWVLVACDIESADAWRRDMEAAGLRYIRTGVWVRTNGAPQFSGDRPAQGVEAFVIAHQVGVRLSWNGGGKSAVWTGPIVNSRDGERIHSSPKPLWLMTALVKDFTNAGDLICDPFAGSATTAAAALAEGRRFIGWEYAPEFHRAATDRLQNQVRQQPLFPARLAQQLELGGGNEG